MKVVLSGNEAVARGAYESGVVVAAAYPGTPSTEILENIARYQEIYCEWSSNEKVAMEVVIGASFAGVRALAAMKHVGLNVAADPFMTLTYLGVDGGLVVVTCDDPELHSSQNEQDNRHYGVFAKVPVLEPTNSQECKELVGTALEISEKFDTPVILRLTTRISHSKSVVFLGERDDGAEPHYERNIQKRLCLPAHARPRHYFIEERLERIREWAEEFHGNEVEWGETDVGFVTSGVAYNYVKEVFPEKSVLKLATTWPIPLKTVRDFARKVDELIVVEELDPIIENELKANHIECRGKDPIPICGELNPAVVRAGVTGKKPKAKPAEGLPPRPPVLCPGCPHRGVYYALNRLKATVFGDIGCYTLGAHPPLSAMDTSVCMGASITDAHGFLKAMGDKAPEHVCATIGESTFVHSGMTGLANVVYNDSPLTTVILDNAITAMTGHQHNPATGFDIRGNPAPMMDLESLCKAMGVEDVRVVNPLNYKETHKALKETMEGGRPAVVIAKSPCVLLERVKYDKNVVVDEEACSGCELCVKLGCPAISFADELAHVDNILCTRCDLCVQICPVDAIVYEEVEG
ncbi:MAG: indolepyruvate ferredoxin oxidoreductase subunit alpha [Candidatus Coatesbacteria bacterium]|nr:MAG: indolepyruvate ferredoxin oxidoreductase subunit alpha [Candidatus Coatesbacteria bacterium]